MIMDSQANLIYVHYFKSKANGTWEPMPLIQLYRKYAQVEYNRAKSGLDKNTEVGLQVHTILPLCLKQSMSSQQ